MHVCTELVSSSVEMYIVLLFDFVAGWAVAELSCYNSGWSTWTQCLYRRADWLAVTYSETA